ncbi:immunoglobulin kappa light chain-like [Labrus bergylta]|uniref:immunoglobulin kappa light chain-like n=1 Tax=Labrus bergylta TaxID=56723 RepID=UPI00331371A2
MTPLMIAFFLECLFLGEMAQTSDPKSLIKVRQESGFISANVGEEVTLSCFCEDEFASKYYWYKQTLGQKPELISMSYKYETNVNFHGEFQNNSRFTLDNTNGRNHLRITDVRITDTATYYCARSSLSLFEFMEGTTLSVKGSGLNFQLLINQSASETTKHGDAVTLSCTVHTGTCDGEHSVYWFRNSEESHSGLIYTQGDRNSSCPRKPNQQSCEYNLPIKSVDHSHAGTYYCAVASCGHILFGNGTKVIITDVEHLVYILSGALTFTIILILLLAVITCVIYKRNNCKCKESGAIISTPSTTDEQVDHNEEDIHYAALRGHRVNRSRRPRNTEDECVYSGIKQ